MFCILSFSVLFGLTGSMILVLETFSCGWGSAISEVCSLTVTAVEFENGFDLRDLFNVTWKLGFQCVSSALLLVGLVISRIEC
jgi:hypothetical protein